MPKKMSLKQRIHSGFILAMAFIMVLASNRLNQRNFSQVEHSVNSVFEDRVVAQEYIYRLNNLFHEKELVLASAALTRNNLVDTTNIKEILYDFAKTKLTKQELFYFEDLKKNFARLQEIELDLGTNPNTNAIEIKKEAVNILKKISKNLDSLSQVQLSEGRKLTQLSKKSLSMNQLLSKLEIAFLLIIGILFLLVLFHKDKRDTIPGEEAI